MLLSEHKMIIKDYHKTEENVKAVLRSLNKAFLPICRSHFKEIPLLISLTNVWRFGEQRWRSGESARLPPVCHGLDSRTRRHMWIEFVVGSRPCSEGFSPGSPVFLLPKKSTLLSSNSIWNNFWVNFFEHFGKGICFS